MQQGGLLNIATALYHCQVAHQQLRRVGKPQCRLYLAAPVSINCSGSAVWCPPHYAGLGPHGARRDTLCHCDAPGWQSQPRGQMVCSSCPVQVVCRLFIWTLC